MPGCLAPPEKPAGRCVRSDVRKESAEYPTAMGWPRETRFGGTQSVAAGGCDAH
jgi:hypothetical protein